MKLLKKENNEIIGGFVTVEPSNLGYICDGIEHQYTTFNTTNFIIEEVSDYYFENIENKKLRNVAYKEESDPLFFKYQRDEITKEEWLAKVEEIKQRYPYR